MFNKFQAEKDKDDKKDAKTNKFNPPPLKAWDDPEFIKTADIAVFNNKSTYNIEIHSKHKSGTKVRNLISNNYIKYVQQFVKTKDKNNNKQQPDPIEELWIHRFYYNQIQLFRLTPQQIVDAWNDKKAWEIVCTKPHLNWDDKPQFQVLEVARPERPKRPGEPGYKPGW